MSDAAPDVGTRFGPYLLKRLIGTGGMGRVYEAEDTSMDRTVALKLISGNYAQDPDYRKRLQREARIAGRLQEPHVVPIHAAGEIDGQLFVDMRLINGIDLDTILKQSGPLPPARAVAILRQIASALDAAHSAGVLHRDVKPGNILITVDDFAYLVDFGIANAATEEKLTHMGDVLGTWTYMAPERFTGADVTNRADVYALACVMYEALTGSPPFSGDRVSVIGAHVSGPIPRASRHVRIPQALDDVMARGMAKRPEDRYATAGEFSRAAEAAVAPGATSQHVMSAPTTPVPQIGADAVSPTVSIPTAGPPSHPPGPLSQPPGPPSYPPGPPSYPPGPASQPPGPPSQWGQQWTPPPAATTKSRRRWLLIAAAVILVVAVAAGLGIWKLTTGKSTQGKSPNTPAVDLSKLDVGRYKTTPRTLPGPATEEEGRYLEAFRLAEAVVNPYEIDSTLDHIYPAATPDPKLAATSIAGTATPIVQPVLEKYGMITAYRVQGYPKRFQDFAREPEGNSLMVMLTSFPNPDAASKAATEMDATDFAVNPTNRHATIPSYPDAMAHYRPDSPSMAVTMADRRLVVSILIRIEKATYVSDLTQRAQQTLEKEVPLMEKLIPGVEAGLTTLPLDPDHMLTRAFVAGDTPKISAQYGSIGPQAASFCQDAQVLREGLFGQAGVDRCAWTPDGTSLYRARDDAAASALLPKLMQAETEEFIDHEVAPPDGLSKAATRCFEQKQAIWSDSANIRFQCVVTFGRYIGFVSSNEEKDVRQRAAAQYAILVNSA